MALRGEQRDNLSLLGLESAEEIIDGLHMNLSGVSVFYRAIGPPGGD